ncbi:MAG: hypothetical protein PWQ70_2204 [Clostridiales bacterium]|nr:hypothetical protein [Clostridiales bacterium]
MLKTKVLSTNTLYFTNFEEIAMDWIRNGQDEEEVEKKLVELEENIELGLETRFYKNNDTLITTGMFVQELEEEYGIKLIERELGR